MYNPMGRYRYWNGIVRFFGRSALDPSIDSVDFSELESSRRTTVLCFSYPPRSNFKYEQPYQSGQCDVPLQRCLAVWGSYRLLERIARNRLLYADIEQFFSASFIFWALSALFPAKETFMERAVIGDEVIPSHVKEFGSNN